MLKFHLWGAQKGLSIAHVDSSLIGPDLRWEDRLLWRTTVGVTTTLGELLDAAAVHFSIQVDLGERGWPTVSEAVGRVLFDSGLTGVGLQLVGYECLTVPDSSGHLRWDRTIASVTFAELEQSSELGLVEGRIDRVYLCLQTPQGGQGPEVWTDVINMLGWSWVAFTNTPKALESFRAAGQMVQLLRRKVTHWVSRGAIPAALLEDVKVIGPYPSRIEVLLDVSPTEAELLLAAAGYSKRGGYWVSSSSSSASAASNYIRTIARMGEMKLIPVDGDTRVAERIVGRILLADTLLAHAEIDDIIIAELRSRP